MTSRAPLTAHAALGWLGSLSIDIEAAAVLDANGTLLAGDPALAGASGPASAQPGGGSAERLLIARSDRHAIVARTGPKAIKRLIRADLEAALNALQTG